MITLVNFAHPITDGQRKELRGLLADRIRVIDVPLQFNDDRGYADQAAEVVATAPISARQWQTGEILVNLPSHNAIAALVLAEIHGRRGDFPDIMRLKKDPSAATTRFVLAEVIRLSQSRASARETR